MLLDIVYSKPEILFHITHFLDLPSIAHLSSTSTDFHALCNDQYLWKLLFKRDFPKILLKPEPETRIEARISLTKEEIDALCNDESISKLLWKRDFPVLMNNEMVSIVENEWKKEYQKRTSCVLVYLSSEACVHCPRIKEKWPAIWDTICNEYKFPVVYVEFEAMTKKAVTEGVTDMGLPAHLQEWVGWFPQFLLFSKNEWNTGRLSCANVFRTGFKERGDPVIIRSCYTFDKKGVKRWIEEALPTLSHTGGH
uniref:Thioredoxin-fold protein n=1 Tax=Pithovirus LCPAC304 TaxID=2506594 RepID=A0A481ZA71_9VIRU|nr:MAG: thioredoxin-fold protein [Pithovirus LCPAC304]